MWRIPWNWKKGFLRPSVLPWGSTSPVGGKEGWTLEQMRTASD
ncbi:hypothetical protein A2U01_0103280, partial [Trifolium medium]|nr:hypothetical protein [Trifolium medium]